MRPSSAPTIKDVARECGLSIATVSKVINGIPVGKDTRRRVEAAIEKLGYQVNIYARGLKTNKSNCIALVLPSLKHPFFAHLADELTACLTRHGCNALLMITNYDPEAEQKCFVMVRQNKADGVIALTYSPEITIDSSIPVVTIDRHFGPDIPCVSSDNYHGGVLAAEKLFELGCRKLLFLRISSRVEDEPDKRHAGFEDFCRRQNVEHESILLHDEDTEAGFYDILRDLIHAGKMDFDGIFCNSDGLACRVAQFLAGHGISVPGQVQIIGYDGIADHFTGRHVCSTIEQPVSQMAEAAVSILLEPDRAAGSSDVCLPIRYIPAGTTIDQT